MNPNSQNTSHVGHFLSFNKIRGWIPQSTSNNSLVSTVYIAKCRRINLMFLVPCKILFPLFVTLPNRFSNQLLVAPSWVYRRLWGVSCWKVLCSRLQRSWDLSCRLLLPCSSRLVLQTYEQTHEQTCEHTYEQTCEQTYEQTCEQPAAYTNERKGK